MQDPYCRFKFGSVTRRGKTVKSGGRNPYFREEEFEFWVDGTNWSQPLQLSCLDEDIGSDDLIGSAEIGVLTYINKGAPHEDLVQLHNGKKDAGVVRCVFAFYPSGQLTVRCVAARDLKDTDAFGKQVRLRRVARCGSLWLMMRLRRTRTASCGYPARWPRIRCARRSIRTAVLTRCGTRSSRLTWWIRSAPRRIRAVQCSRRAVFAPRALLHAHRLRPARPWLCSTFWSWRCGTQTW